jgi:periplasmic protein TonB
MAAAIPGIRVAARWRRLGISLALSLGLHLAVVLPFIVEPRPMHPGEPEPLPVRVRISVPEEPRAPVASVTQGQSVRSPAPGRTARSQEQKRVAAAPAPGGPERIPYVAMQTAYRDVPAEVQAEKLRQAQRSVPRSIDLARPAKPAGPIRIDYPPEVLGRGEKGHVVLEVFVSRRGRVDEVVVLDQTGPAELSRAAAEAVRKARFRPAEGPDGKLRSRVTLRVDFSYE